MGLDAPPAGERQCGGHMGSFGVHWPSGQPTVGSIGGLLRSVRAAVGDDVLLCFDEATVQAEIVAQSSIHPWVAAALLAGGPVILPADLGGNGNGAALEPQGDASSRRLCTLRENDSAHVRFVMDATGGNRREAARILGITLRQLQRKLAEMKGAS